MACRVINGHGYCLISQLMSLITQRYFSLKAIVQESANEGKLHSSSKLIDTYLMQSVATLDLVKVKIMQVAEDMDDHSQASKFIQPPLDSDLLVSLYNKHLMVVSSQDSLCPYGFLVDFD